MANSGLIGGIVQGVGNFASSLINNAFNKKQQRRAFRHDQQMAEYAYGNDIDMWNRQSQWNQDMWNLQNEYNLPSNQMQRLRDAGLNPNLIYGNGASGGTAGGVQSAQMPKYQQVRANYQWSPVDIPNFVQMFQDIKMSNAQIDNVKAQTDLAKQKEMTETINRSLLAVKRAAGLYDNNYKYELSKYSTEMARNALYLQRQQLANQMEDTEIKKHMVGRTEAEAGLKQMEYQFFKNLGVKGLRDIAPFLQLLLQFYRR